MTPADRPTINDRPSTDRGTSAVAPPRPLVVKVTPYPVHPMPKSEGYFFRPFRSANSSNVSIFSKFRQVLILSLNAERRMGEMLLETDRAKGARLEGRNIGGTPIQPPKDGTPTLAEIGVTKHGVSYD